MWNFYEFYRRLEEADFSSMIQKAKAKQAQAPMDPTAAPVQPPAQGGGGFDAMVQKAKAKQAAPMQPDPAAAPTATAPPVGSGMGGDEKVIEPEDAETPQKLKQQRSPKDQLQLVNNLLGANYANAVAITDWLDGKGFDLTDPQGNPATAQDLLDQNHFPRIVMQGVNDNDDTFTPPSLERPGRYPVKIDNPEQLKEILQAAKKQVVPWEKPQDLGFYSDKEGEGQRFGRRIASAKKYPSLDSQLGQGTIEQAVFNVLPQIATSDGQVYRLIDIAKAIYGDGKEGNKLRMGGVNANPGIQGVCQALKTIILKDLTMRKNEKIDDATTIRDQEIVPVFDIKNKKRIKRSHIKSQKAQQAFMSASPERIGIINPFKERDFDETAEEKQKGDYASDKQYGRVGSSPKVGNLPKQPGTEYTSNDPVIQAGQAKRKAANDAEMAQRLRGEQTEWVDFFELMEHYSQ